jgi:hypothetical protein
MRKSNLCSSAALTALLLTTWTFGAAAEQPSDPTTTTTTTQPTAVTTGPVVSDPLVSVGTEHKTWPNTPLLVTGTVLLGASYGASVLAAGVSERDSYDKLYYPVAGPWLALDDRNCEAERCGNQTLGTTLLIGSGILQGIGALGIVTSLFIPETTTRNWYLIGNEDFAVMPVAGTAEVGAAAVGRF